MVKGSAATVTMQYENPRDDAKNGCNISQGPDSRLVVSASATASTVTFQGGLPSTLEFPNCADRPYALTPTATGETTISFAFASVVGADGVGANDFDLTGMTFKLIVVDPAPQVVDGDGAAGPLRHM